MKLQVLKILTILLFIVSCNGKQAKVDISNNSVEITIQRLDMDLFQNFGSADGLNYSEYEEIKKNYGKFFKLYLENIITVGRYQDSASLYYLNRFLTDLQIKEVSMVTLQLFPNMDDLNTELSNAFKRYNVLFPSREIPNVYSFISGFSFPMVVDSSILGIGLDFYLGRDKDYYRLLGIPAYKSRNLNKENIVPDAVKSWIATEFEIESDNSDLLSHMIYHGKLLYTMDLILPNTPDSLKIGFSSREMDWVKKNEKDMWFHFAENELLYNKEGKQIQKYIGEGPFTPGFPDGSPGMTGRWMGWQIVRKYMENTDALDLQNLFNTSDSQKILKISKYKPS